jgi:type II secretory pathway pseudopilin PulG
MNKQGISLIEIVIAISIMAIVFSATISLLISNIKLPLKSEKIIVANGLIQEAEAALRSLRHSSWSGFSPGLVQILGADSSWGIIPSEGEEQINGYSRRIEIEPVYRDSNLNLVETPGPDDFSDPLSKSISIRVSWEDGFGEHSSSKEILLSAWSSRNFKQNDWRGGPGQRIFLSDDEYFSADNIDFSTGDLRLALSATSTYFLSGELESSAIDLSASEYLALGWEDNSDPACDSCEIKLQIKTATDQAGSPGEWSTTWSGPDGEDGDEEDFFLINIGEAISMDHQGDEWFKYKIFLSGDASSTPVMDELKLYYQ